MRIALLGTRGIPARYGGFETFAEELSKRLVQRGHQVRVYCRQNGAGGADYLGAELCHVPTIRHKYLDTIAHTFFSTLHLLWRRCDVALYCNGANAIFTLAPRLLGIPVALNVDGLERNRKKWNRLAKAWYLLSEWLATFCPSVVIEPKLVLNEVDNELYQELLEDKSAIDVSRYPRQSHKRLLAAAGCMRKYIDDHSSNLDAWKKLASKAAPGGDVDNIKWVTSEGITVKPLYTKADIADQSPRRS